MNCSYLDNTSKHTILKGTLLTGPPSSENINLNFNSKSNSNFNCNHHSRLRPSAVPQRSCRCLRQTPPKRGYFRPSPVSQKRRWRARRGQRFISVSSIQSMLGSWSRRGMRDRKISCSRLNQGVCSSRGTGLCTLKLIDATRTGAGQKQTVAEKHMRGASRLCCPQVGGAYFKGNHVITFITFQMIFSITSGTRHLRGLFLFPGDPPQLQLLSVHLHHLRLDRADLDMMKHTKNTAAGHD